VDVDGETIRRSLATEIDEALASELDEAEDAVEDPWSTA
jgi:hypothetical protein